MTTWSNDPHDITIVNVYAQSKYLNIQEHSHIWKKK
jgi:hypothetical protein